MRGRRSFVPLMALLTLLLVMLTVSPVMAEENTAVVSGQFQATFRQTPVEVTGYWKKVKKGYRFIRQDGAVKAGWLKIGPCVYHLNKRGNRATGYTKVGRKYYFFRKNGRQRYGYIRVNGRRYYFDPADHGAKSNAVIVNGVPNTAPKTKDEGEDTTVRNSGYSLEYDEDGNFYDRKGYQIRKSTIKKLLQTALQPVGRTMYIWGGGWGASGYGNAGSVEASTIGVSPRWEAFFQKAGRGYSYRNYRYYSHLGLDCSGFVGWTLYNTFNSFSGHGDYVMLAQNMARTYANWGWGSYTSAGNVSNYHAGDIMSLGSGHVYIVLGECKDGSVVLVHSSPQGVMITGTATRGGRKRSQAYKLARKYMKKYFPKWFRKFPDTSRGSSYLTRYSRMRWKLKGQKSVMSDPDGLTKMSTKEVLEALLGPA